MCLPELLPTGFMVMVSLPPTVSIVSFLIDILWLSVWNDPPFLVPDALSMNGFHSG